MQGFGLVVRFTLRPGHEAAFEEHERRPHTVRFLAERERHLAGVEVAFLDALEGTVPGSAAG